ncbi:hypothetical protein BH20VER1_BH20VER1_22390 [soil metagenome]
MEEIRQRKCLEAAYKTGVRIKAPGADALSFTTTGQAEVVVEEKSGNLLEWGPSCWRRWRNSSKR